MSIMGWNQVDEVLQVLKTRHDGTCVESDCVSTGMNTRTVNATHCHEEHQKTCTFDMLKEYVHVTWCVPFVLPGSVLSLNWTKQAVNASLLPAGHPETCCLRFRSVVACACILV